MGCCNRSIRTSSEFSRYRFSRSSAGGVRVKLIQRQPRDLRAASVQRILQSREFGLVAAALGEFNIGDGAESPNLDGSESCRRTGVSASEPDDDLRINQHGGQSELREPSGLWRGARNFRT